ncbi:expressed unknown protein [Seminavis robusta]|uniref:Uncharacterized protein n=1 Tax=Seminavis robusta TaxID=568900 RepID=A0A9N8F2V9_9STRA|nr:expressed unknown protein [Seminavis robusta]|eukprot:Sro2584_g331882.1  (748) ;mRNA; f:3760-6079
MRINIKTLQSVIKRRCSASSIVKLAFCMIFCVNSILNLFTEIHTNSKYPMLAFKNLLKTETKEDIATTESNEKQSVLGNITSQWELKLAQRRATQVSAINEKTSFQSLIHTQQTIKLKIALLLQIGNTDLWPEMLTCITNIATAAKLSSTAIDIYISLHENTRPNDLTNIQYSVSNLKGIKQIEYIFVQNRGADVEPFLRQILQISKKEYDILLKLHTKSDLIWRERAIQSLCGTPEHIISIWKHLSSNANVDMVVPLGTVFSSYTDPRNVFPHLKRKYNLRGKTDFAKVFDNDTISAIKRVHDVLFLPSNNRGEYVKLNDNNLTIVAGTIFWVRMDVLRSLNYISTLVNLYEEFSLGYSDNKALEHILERLIPTEIVAQGRNISEFPPAPRIFALYFPQYHIFPENDRFWKDGFTEWSFLRSLDLEGIRKPLPLNKNGLGYYNLLNKDIRSKQANMARSAGITGFVYYHYWFVGKNAPICHKAMFRVLEEILIDGEPDMPFMLSWANEPWNKRWSGKSSNNTVLLNQEYGDIADWTLHFKYLLNFFRHPNYILIHGKPVLVIYRLGHLSKQLPPMLNLWQSLAIENGYPGIHLIHTIGSFYSIDKETSKLEERANLDAAFHFWPAATAGTGMELGNKTASTFDFDVNTPVQYWGAFTGFDRRPRVSNATPILRSVGEFRQGLSSSFQAMSNLPQKEIEKNFFFITAWNEWNEQAVLEPDNINEFGYLKALNDALIHFPAKNKIHVE